LIIAECSGSTFPVKTRQERVIIDDDVSFVLK